MILVMYLMRKLAIEYVKRRKEGIALADEIEVKYRREGKFFDEILGGK